MGKSIKSLREGIAWHMRHEPGAPRQGDLAPDFEVSDSRGERTVRLSDFRGKRPVALIFGSFT